MKLHVDPDRKVKIKVGDGKVEFRLGKIIVPPGKKISLKK
jgi:hypothetical protein